MSDTRCRIHGIRRCTICAPSIPPGELADQVAAPVADVNEWHARLRGIAAAANRPVRPVYGQAGRWT